MNPPTIPCPYQMLSTQLLKSPAIGATTALLRRLHEIVPSSEWPTFERSGTFHQCVMAGHDPGAVFQLQRSDRGWLFGVGRKIEVL